MKILFAFLFGVQSALLAVIAWQRWNSNKWLSDNPQTGLQLASGSVGFTTSPDDGLKNIWEE